MLPLSLECHHCHHGFVDFCDNDDDYDNKVMMLLMSKLDLGHLEDILQSETLWETPVAGGEIDSLTPPLESCGGDGGGEWLDIRGVDLDIRGGEVDIRGGEEGNRDGEANTIGGEVDMRGGGGGESSSNASSCERGARATTGWQGLPWKYHNL